MLSKSFAIFLIIFSGAFASGASFYEGTSRGKKSKSAGPSRFALVLDYSLYNATFSSFNSTEEINGSGTGFSAGIELISPTVFLGGHLVNGLYYTTQTLQASPASGAESLKMKSIEMPFAWGFLIGSRFYFGMGAMVKYGMGNIERTTPVGTKSLTYNDYGINPLQVEGLGILRFFITPNKFGQIFLDFKYGMGLMDRAIGGDDVWKDDEMFFGFGVGF